MRGVVQNKPIRVLKPMKNFNNATSPTFVLAIGFWDQSERLECVCVLELIGEVLRSRLIWRRPPDRKDVPFLTTDRKDVPSLTPDRKDVPSLTPDKMSPL